jgi:uncharacterized protein (DUF3820 family)
MPELDDNSKMPFGVYKGRKMVNVPAVYLLWLWDEKKYTKEVGVYIEENLQALKQELKHKS